MSEHTDTSTGETTETERFLRFSRWGEPIIPFTLLLFILFFRSPFSFAVCAYPGLVF